MSLWRQLTRGFGVLANRKAADQNVADEVQHYLEETAAAFVASGLSPEAAARAARLELGSAGGVQEQVRASGWENAVETLWADLNHSFRRLRRSPGFAVVSLLTLALGIGANTAIFSVIDGVLLKPLHYPHPEQLIALWQTAPGVNIKDLDMSPSLYFTYREEGRVFQDVSMWSESTSSVTGVAQPEEVPVLMVTHRLLPILGIQPEWGRGFLPSDEESRSAPTVMLTDGYWRTRFGADRSVLGRRILIDGAATEVIGVLPRSFEFMDKKVSMVQAVQMDRAETHQFSFNYQGIARLKPGATMEQASADIRRMLPLVPTKFPPNPGYSAMAFTEARLGPNLRSLKDDLIGDSGNTLWVLMGTVGMVLLIACANVANLSLVRADGRQQELAIRAALGAGWGRIARELLLESLLLGIAGGTLGLGLAYGSLRALAASELTPLPRLGSVSIDPWALAFTLGISVASGLIFGLIPVFKYGSPRLLNALRSGGRTLSQSRERHRARSILVVVQVALALVLLVSSGLMLRTFQALHHVDPGFSRAEEVQTIGISIPEAQAKEPERVIRSEESILKKLAAIAGVKSVAITNTVPMDGGFNDPIYAEDHVYREGTIPPVRRYKYVSPGYVSTMGSRLVAGRELTWDETYSRMPVAMISENLARELWHDPRGAVGKRIRATAKDDWRSVVGVVADLRDKGVDQPAPTIVYWPLLQKNFNASETRVERNVAFVIRTPRAGSTTLLSEIRRAVWSVNPNLPVANVRTLEAVYDQSLARTSFTMTLLAIAGGMALVLGVVGIYGVVSYSVSQRTREIGIRLALGASIKDVTRMIVRQGVGLSAVGVVCGFAAALPLTRLMRSLLFDVSPSDPLTYAGAAAGLIVAAVLASYLPTRRAAAVDPVQVLGAM